MVATNDVVVTPDRLVRVIMTTMAAARFYRENWPEQCLTLLVEICKQLQPLVKIFGRPINQELPEHHFSMAYKVIVVKEWGGFLVGQTPHIVCISDIGWTLVNKTTGSVFAHSPQLLASLIGEDMDGMRLFIDACAYRVRELFKDRRQRLYELENQCLLELMHNSFDRTKYTDTRLFIADLH